MKKPIFITFCICIVLLIAFFAHLFWRNYSHQATIPALPDALLTHGYWLSQKDNGQVGLSIRSDLEVKAAAILSKQYSHMYVVIDAGPIWGPKYPSLGKVMKDEAMRLGIPAEKIILQDTAMDTHDEIMTFLDEAKQHQWTHLIDLAAGQHDITIPVLYKNEHATATYVTIESILRTYGTSTDRHTINQLSLSSYEIGLSLYEDIVRVALIVDPHYQLLGTYAKNERNKKTSYGAVPLLPIDKYQL